MVKTKEAFSEQAILCDNQCSRDIQGKYIKMDVGLGFTQNYHESCSKQIKKLLEKGYKFVRRKPHIELMIPHGDNPNMFSIRLREREGGKHRFHGEYTSDFAKNYQVLGD